MAYSFGFGVALGRQLSRLLFVAVGGGVERSAARRGYQRLFEFCFCMRRGAPFTRRKSRRCQRWAQRERLLPWQARAISGMKNEQQFTIATGVANFNQEVYRFLNRQGRHGRKCEGVNHERDERRHRKSRGSYRKSRESARMKDRNT